MPTYEYLCERCGHAFERWQKMTEDPLRDCPACGSDGARRQISAGAGLLFRGPGFYATDYRKGGPGADGKKGGGGTDAGDGGGPVAAEGGKDAPARKDASARKGGGTDAGGGAAGGGRTSDD